MPSRVVDTLPSYERVLFRPVHLELALAQVKFPPLARFDEEGYLTDFKDAMSGEYPLPAVEHALGLMVTSQGVSQAKGPMVYRFSTLDYGWSATLTADAISLESRNAYTDINQFAARLSGILEKVRDTLRPRHQLRFGLRYVNEFRHEQRGETYEGWAALGLNPDLLGMGTRNVLGGTVQQTVSEIRTDRPDGSLVIRHGFLDGTTVPPAAGRKQKTGRFYLLDLDYFNEQPGDFDSRPLDRMIVYNDFLYRVFRWCVGNGDLYRDLQA